MGTVESPWTDARSLAIAVHAASIGLRRGRGHLEASPGPSGPRRCATAAQTAQDALRRPRWWRWAIDGGVVALWTVLVIMVATGEWWIIPMGLAHVAAVWWASAGRVRVDPAVVVEPAARLGRGGLTILSSMELHHAAIEGATMGASTSDPDRCAVALATATMVLGHSPTGSSCSASATMVEVTLEDGVPWTIPPLPSSVSTTERSAIR